MVVINTDSVFDSTVLLCGPQRGRGEVGMGRQQEMLENSFQPNTKTGGGGSFGKKRNYGSGEGWEEKRLWE